MSSAAVEGEQRVIDALKARALEALDAGGIDDRFWLLRAGQPGDPALVGNAMTTAMRVRETEPSAGAADLGAALMHARAILASGAEGRAAEIHLLTDLQASAFPAPVNADADAPPVVIWHPGTEAPVNRAISSVEVGGGISPVAGQRTTVAAAVAGATAGGPVDIRLTIDDRLAAAASARPGETALLSLPARPAGVIAGSVEIDADALHADDRRFFAARVLPPPAVSLTGAAEFVADGLEVLAEGPARG
jgi:hypothetical protein